MLWVSKRLLTLTKIRILFCVVGALQPIDFDEKLNIL